MTPDETKAAFDALTALVEKQAALIEALVEVLLRRTGEARVEQQQANATCVSDAFNAAVADIGLTAEQRDRALGVFTGRLNKTP